MDIQLSEHFDNRKLLRFSLPSIVMMIFTSIYSIVDGIYVSNFVGNTPFAAISFTETGALMLTVYCLKRYKAKYNY